MAQAKKNTTAFEVEMMLNDILVGISYYDAETKLYELFNNVSFYDAKIADKTDEGYIKLYAYEIDNFDLRMFVDESTEIVTDIQVNW